MEFVDSLCDHKRANLLLGLEDDMLDDDDDDDRSEDDMLEEVDFEEDETLFSDGDTDSQTYTYDGTLDTTYDGTGTTSMMHDDDDDDARNSHLLLADHQPAYQKTTPLFEAIDSHYWTTVTTFLTSGRWAEGGRSKLPMVPLREEARQWSVCLDKSGRVTSRRLPLHAALVNAAPLHIVERLVDLYPTGVSCVDSQGNLPLHLVFMTPENDTNVMDFMLEAYPQAVLVKNGAKSNHSANHRGGLLPMECVPASHKSYKMKAMVQKGRDRARELSLQTYSSACPRPPPPSSGKRLVSALKASSKATTTPTMTKNGSEHELMEIKKELQELRRAGSTSPSSCHKKQEDATHSETLEGWMRSLAQGGLFLGMGSASKNNMSAAQETSSSQTLTDMDRSPEPSPFDEPNDPSSKSSTAAAPLSRWKRSFQKLSTARSGDNEEEDDMTKEESVEVNLHSSTRSINTSSSVNKYTKKFNFGSVFRHKRHKSNPDSSYMDSVTVRSRGRSVPDQSISRFTLSAVPEADTAAPHATKGSAFNRSANTSMSTKRTTASTARRLFSNRHQRPSWLNNTHRRSQSAKEGIVVFGGQNEKEGAPADYGGVFASAWKFDSSEVAQAMSGLLLIDDGNDGQKTQDRGNKTRVDKQEQKKSGIFGSKVGHVFLGGKSNQHSFLENSLLVPSEPEGQNASRFTKRPSWRKTLSRAMKKDKEEDTSANSFEQKEKSVSGNHCFGNDGDKDSDFTPSNSSNTSGSESISSVSVTSSNSDQDDDDDILDKSSSKKSETRRNKSHGSSASRICAQDGGLSTVLSQASQIKASGSSKVSKTKTNSSRFGLQRKVHAGDKSDPFSIDPDKKKRSFGLFRRKKLSPKVANTSSGPDEDLALLASQMKQSTLETTRGSLKASHWHDFSHVEPVSGNHTAGHKRQESVSSLEASIARAILPKKEDWRSEYQTYLSSTHSVGPVEKIRTMEVPVVSPDSVSTSKKSSKLRGILKKTHRKLKSKDGQRRIKQTSLDGGLTTTSTPCTDDILNDLENGFPFLLDSAVMPHCRRVESFNKKQPLPIEKASTQSTGPVVSECNVSNSDEGNVYLVRVQF